MFDELQFYNHIQRDFPLELRPYFCAAEALGMSERMVLSLLARDLGAGRISRIGAVFAPNTIGVSTLAALAVPSARMDRVAGRVSADPAVSHNYARDGHHYNLWFVAGARDRPQLDAVLEDIAYDVGQAPLDLPLEREYHIDLGFPLSRGKHGATETRGPRETCTQPAQALSHADWRLIAALEAGLPLTPFPYHALGRRCGVSPTEILCRLAQWHNTGIIRRFGAILHHRKFGYAHNAMCVWNVPDARVDAIGMRLAHVPHVTLCYRRPRRLPDWPYNLFAMVHARSQTELQATLARFNAVGSLAAMPRAVLPASRCFKQRGTRYGCTPAAA
ncbi:siroheme decarboxylase subunit beta [Cupriavidus sp. RAF12]|uniref:siroheme decarboxylase subunit beta n=1 Tax=Cupriavidus sp. RAF12 TaxID=3233050 RepID=UPI003F900AE4